MSIDLTTVGGRVLFTAEHAADVRAALIEAVKRDAYLRGVDLRDADLRDADLQGADHAEVAIARTRILPDEGEVIGWKQAAGLNGPVIVKLSIPSDAKRSHGAGRKCRAAQAKVLAITDLSGNAVDEAHSRWDAKFLYRVGETVVPREPFDDNMWNECASGIHFYITRLEAENHL